MVEPRSSLRHAIPKGVLSYRDTAVCLAAVSLVLILGTLAENIVAAENRTKVTREADLKAAFLYNFAQFVEWPPEAFSKPDAQFVIGVLGVDPFGVSLDQMVGNEMVRNRKIVVRRYRDLREITPCHILYISPSETAQLDQIFQVLRGKSTLTVGESGGVMERECMVRFLLVEDKLRLRINLQAATAARLTISSKLLRQAEVSKTK